MQSNKVDDAWHEEAISYYTSDHTLSETLEFINQKYKVSDRSLRQLLKTRGINRGVSGAQKLKRFTCKCLICKNQFQGRTPTSVMCDACVGTGAVGVTKERLRKYGQLRKIMSYGLDVQTYELLLSKQQRKCGLCLQIRKSLCVDHCHLTGVVRGLLCHRCNLILGQIEKAGQQDWLKRAEQWLTQSHDKE